MRARMAAREPIRGSLTFLDSLGNPHLKGIDVGQDQSTREPRSHIEGGTVATAIWTFGRVIDPYDPRHLHTLDYRIPVNRLLERDSIEGLMDRCYELQARIAVAEQEQKRLNVSVDQAKKLSNLVARHPCRVPEVQRPARPAPEGVRGAEIPRQGRGARQAPDRGRRAAPSGRRAALAADPAGDDLQRLPDDQGQDRRAGLRQTGRDQPEDRRVVRERLPDPRVLHQPAIATLDGPGGLARRPEGRDPLPQPDAVPGHGRERPLHPGAFERLRHQLHEGAVRRLAPGDGPDGHRRLRRHLPELAGGAADDDRVLRGRAGRVRLPARVHAAEPARRRAVRVADPPAVARQPDDRADADPGGRHGQDARLDRHAGHVPAGLHRPELLGARRQQHGRRRLRRRLGPAGREPAPGARLRPALLHRRAISS